MAGENMKVLYASDIHAARGHLVAMLDVALRESADALIIGGDIVCKDLDDGADILSMQRDYLTREFIPAIEWLKGRLPDIGVFLDMGNDDLAFNRDVLEAHDGTLLNLLHMSCRKLTAGVDIIGYMNVPPTPFVVKDWEKPDTRIHPFSDVSGATLYGLSSGGGEISKCVLDIKTSGTIERDLSALSKMVRGKFVFVSHCPPYRTGLDMLCGGRHVGSVAVREFIEKWASDGSLIASLHGHIHESPFVSGSIVADISGAMCINPGQEEGEDAEFRYALFEILGGSGGPKVRLIRRDE